MKPVVTFFLLLAALLTGGGAAHAGSHDGGRCDGPAGNIETNRPGSLNTSQGYAISADDLRHENPYIVSVEDANEENIIRKHIFPAGYLCTFSFEIISSHPDTSRSAALSFYRYSSCTGSCKYIEQRVLRI